MHKATREITILTTAIVISILMCGIIIKAKESEKINPYISLDGLVVDVNNIYTAVEPSFQKSKAEPIDYYIIKLKDSIKYEWRKELEENGLELLGYLPYNSYIAKCSNTQVERIKTLHFVYWVGLYQPYLKLSREIRQAISNRDFASLSDGSSIKLIVILFPGESSDKVTKLFSFHELGKVINAREYNHESRIWIQTNEGDFIKLIRLLSNLKEVAGIEVFRQFSLTNDAARWVHQKFQSGQYPLYTNNLRGQGQVGGISDSGFDYDMCYFRDTALGSPPIDAQEPWGDVGENPNQRKQIIYYAMDATTCGQAGTAGAESGNNHGTHTLGSFVGDNFATSCTGNNGDSGDGMALCSKVVLEDLGNNLQFINNPCGTIYDLLSIARQDGAKIHTNSWGYPCNGCPCGGNIYGGDSRSLDQFVWENKDMLVFFAAGNSSSSCSGCTSTICSPGTCKNCATVGATNHDTSATSIASFSSCGWTYDWRMKPDFTAQGNSVSSAANDGSTSSNNCSTTGMSGTSMATPTAAGYGLLTRQYFTEGYYPTGSPTPANQFQPSAALLKATMLNSAVDMTGVSGDPPNKIEGWGRITLDEALYFPGDSRKLWIVDETSGSNTGFSKCYFINNNSSSEPLKVTLVWMDYPASLYASPALVNDLMLEVSNPGASTTYHLTLDQNYNIIQTTNSSDPQDDRNTIEQILINNPQAGIWSIKVRGINIPYGPQPYAIVATGDVSGSSPPEVPTGVNASPTADNRITVSWTAVSGASCYNVYRSFGPCPGSTWFKIANCVTNTSYNDDTVSGGSTYSYKVNAVYPGECESDQSNCVQATATGICTLAPSFTGATSVSNNKTSSCGLTVQWQAATSQCPDYPNIKYTIYKSIDPDFIPSSSNQVATCISTTSWADDNVASGITFYYVVRAEDSRTSGGSGPCNNGNFETNTIKASGSPTGAETVLFLDNAGDTGSAQMTMGGSGGNWTNSTARNHTPGGSHSYASGSANNQCSWIISPTINLTGATYYTLEFWTLWDIEPGFDSGIIQISTDNGSTWIKVAPKQGYPDKTINGANTCNGSLDPSFSSEYLFWKYYEVDLTPYANSNLRFRFKYGADGGLNKEGWYIDDIRVVGYQNCINNSPNCTTPPRFSGLASASNTSTSTCQIELSWNSAESTCPAGPNIKYHIYKSTDPNFNPSPSNRIAQCYSGTSYADYNVNYATRYYYIVRAEDSTNNGSGPCNNGNSDLNFNKKNAVPAGPYATQFSDDFEAGMNNWSITGSWTWNASQSHSGTHSAYGPISPSGCHYLTLANFLSIPTNLTPTLRFWKRIDTMNGWNGGKVEASSDGTNWVKLNVSPNYNGTKTFDEPCMANGETCFTGSATTWTQHTADISFFTGNNLKVRFTWAVRWTSMYNGWWIDDVEIGWGSQCTTQTTNLPGSVLNSLRLSKSTNLINLNWNEPGGTCSYNSYGIYRGTLPFSQYNHSWLSCSATSTSYSDNNATASYYYLVVPLNNDSDSEGSYGLDSNSSQIPQAATPCKTQHNTTSCN